MRIAEYVSDRDWYWYLQFHVQWGRLYSRIWDSILAAQASHVGSNIEAIEALDDSVRINVLRLLIRGSNLRYNHSLFSPSDTTHISMDWEYNMRFCQDLATSTIDAIVTYMRAWPFQRAMGIYSTLVLLQCLYFIVQMTDTGLRPTVTFSDIHTVKRPSCGSDLPPKLRVVAAVVLVQQRLDRKNDGYIWQSEWLPAQLSPVLPA
ncbi:hypothetical protein AnigIFM59636_006937 [Aspergillus niger]|nr:hypothetical protein AnigIFM59636_006937 [Aspergillus niger]